MTKAFFPMLLKQATRRRFLEQSGLLLASGACINSGLMAQTPISNVELDARLFPGFDVQTIDTNDVSIHTLVGGSGPPVLLLHGAPQSHFAWAEVAVQLARDFTVVATDLRRIS
jgi:hypothetical protein